MKTITLFLLTGILFFTYSQINYEVIPGTKENQLIFSLSNISEILNAENVQVKLTRTSPNLFFNSEDLIINNISPKEETEVLFLFDIKRETPINQKDTIEFQIVSNNGVYKTKQFILSYLSPKDYALEQNFPNPFNPTTTIKYQLPVDSKVTLKIYGILGNEVTTLFDEFQEAGYKEIKFDAGSLSSAVYIYRLTADKFILTKKMILMK